MAEFALHPRLAADTHRLAAWPLCEVLLMDDARYPWLILVPRIAGAVEVIDLPADRQVRLWEEVARAAQALRGACAPDKLNIAALGNLVPQLHVHVIARVHGDAAWPAPVWGRGDPLPRSADQREALARKLGL